MKKITQFIPALAWLKTYDGGDFRGDLVAGLTTAVMLIPQGMAYAMLAGLPPIVGLYASTVPLVVYAIFGTSRQLAVGPVAMVSLLTAAGVGTIATGGTEAYVMYAVLLALMVGAMQLGMGLVRMGMLTNFLSHPILAGFTSAAALIIALSQLKHLLGIDLERSNHIHEILIQAFSQIGNTQIAALIIGAAGIALLMGMKRYRPKWPRALIVVVLGTLAVWGLGLHDQGVAIVGDVPAGLPSFTVPEFSWDAMSTLFPMALTIALVSFMESIAVAKNIAQKNRYEVDANQELIGLGSANIAGAFFGSYPVTGGFSRTAVNDQAGAKTGMAAIITAGVIALTLVLLTPLFYYLPQAILAAIIMTAVFGLVDFREAKHLWKVEKTELALMGITFVATLSVGIEEGILIGAGASLLWFVYKTTTPHVAVLGKFPDSTVYRNVNRFDEVETTDGLLTVRIDSQFYYGNVTFLKDTLNKLEKQMNSPLRAVVLDGSSINQLDSSAETALHHIVEDYQARGIGFYLASPKGPVRDMMRRASLWKLLGDDHITYTVHEAVEAACEEYLQGVPGPAPGPEDRKAAEEDVDSSPFAPPEKMPI
ncbi:MAG: SulP family inorganic anion transporter [Persicimonas sp.]